MALGRPTKYSEEIIKKTMGYIETCGDLFEIKQKPVIKDGLLTEEDYVKESKKLPTIEGLANYLDINKDTLYEWCKIHKDFSDVIDNLQKMQADMLINNGLSGDYNPTIAKVLLTKHGYREGIDATTNDKDIVATQFSPAEQQALLSLLND